MTRLRIQVVYALAHAQDLVSVELEPGASAREAVAASGIAARHPEILGGGLRLGIWGKAAPLEAPLRDGDRIEILRPLATDPKEQRRRRAQRR